MSSGPDDTPEAPENGAETPPEEPKGPFNPFLNEEDMFKVVLYVGAAVLVVAVLVLLEQAIF
jgi:hypothetical protein